MSLALVVLLVALTAGALAFLASATHHLDPIDPTSAERAVVRARFRHPKVDRFVRQRLDRRSRGGLLLTISFAIVVVAALVVGLLLDMIEAGSGLAELDDAAAEWGAANADSTAVDILEVVTHLGGTPVCIAALTAAALAAFSQRRNTEVFAFAAAIGIGQLLVSNVLKLIVDRDRPNVQQLVESSGSSFPSGHATAAAATWAAVALLMGRDVGRIGRAVVAGAAVVIAIAVAVSRALLGVHWVTDVVAGVVIGWAWFLLVAIAFGGRAQRLGDPASDQPEGVEQSVSDRGSMLNSRRSVVPFVPPSS